MKKSDLPIGIMDSGVGGISVLKELKRALPSENYIYLSDTENAPYGTKSVEEVRVLAENAVKRLMLFPCKAIVIACNTATAAAADPLRQMYPDLPIVGLEPAVLPAARRFAGESVLVLSTEATGKTERFKRLVSVASEKSRIVCASVQKTVSFVEAGMADSPALISYLRSELYPYRKTKFSAVVLGCTHFPFAKRAIKAALGYEPLFYDGAAGAAERLRNILSTEVNLNTSGIGGETLWLQKEFVKNARKMINIG